MSRIKKIIGQRECRGSGIVSANIDSTDAGAIISGCRQQNYKYACMSLSGADNCLSHSVIARRQTLSDVFLMAH